MSDRTTFRSAWLRSAGVAAQWRPARPDVRGKSGRQAAVDLLRRLRGADRLPRLSRARRRGGRQEPRRQGDVHLPRPADHSQSGAEDRGSDRGQGERYRALRVRARTPPMPTSPSAPRRRASRSAAPPRRPPARKCAIPTTSSCSAPDQTRRPPARCPAKRLIAMGVKGGVVVADQQPGDATCRDRADSEIAALKAAGIKAEFLEILDGSRPGIRTRRQLSAQESGHRRGDQRLQHQRRACFRRRTTAARRT